jgi:hypothetical protein
VPKVLKVVKVQQELKVLVAVPVLKVFRVQ